MTLMRSAYLGDLLFVLSNSVRLCGKGQFLLMFVVGVAAKVSLLIAFIVVIKAMVGLLTMDVDSTVSLLGKEFSVEFLTFASLSLIPIIFAIAGVVVYLGQVLSSRYTTMYVNKLRMLNLDFRLQEVPRQETSDRSSYVRELVNRTDPDLRKCSHSVITGLIELLQAGVVASVSFIGLAYLNATVAIGTVVVFVVAIPIYIKMNGRLSREEKEFTISYRQEMQALRTAAINSESVRDANTLAVHRDLSNLFLGPLAQKQSKLDIARMLSARRALGPIYGLMGGIIAYLVADILLSDNGVDATQVSDFAVIALVLRFIAGEVQSILGAIRGINQEYMFVSDLIRPVCGSSV